MLGIANPAPQRKHRHAQPHAPAPTHARTTIGPLAARFGVSPETLRVWEQKGLLPPARRTPGGHSRYGHEHVVTLGQILGPEASTRPHGAAP